MSRIFVCVLILAAVAAADTFTFDFEGLPPMGGTTSITDVDGTGMLTVSALGGGTILGLSDLSLFGGPPGFGMSTLGAFGPPDTLGISFMGLPAGHTVTGITFTFGDFGLSDTDEITMTVLRTDGVFAGSSTVDGFDPLFNSTDTGLIEPSGLLMLGTDWMIMSQTGPPGGNSLYYDNFVITTDFASGESPMGDFSGGGAGAFPGTTGQFPPVPEPVSTVLVGVGLALLGLRRRLR